jgi:hypothetical protein
VLQGRVFTKEEAVVVREENEFMSYFFTKCSAWVRMFPCTWGIQRLYFVYDPRAASYLTSIFLSIYIENLFCGVLNLESF